MAQSMEVKFEKKFFKFFKTAFKKIQRDMVCINRPYPFKSFKGYPLQILPCPILNTLSQYTEMYLRPASTSMIEQGRFLGMKWAPFKWLFWNVNDSVIRLMVSIISGISLWYRPSYKNMSHYDNDNRYLLSLWVVP